MVEIVPQVQTLFYYPEAGPNHLISTKCQKHMGINFCKADVLEKGPLNINVAQPRCS